MVRKMSLLFGLCVGVSSGCFLKKSPPPKPPVTEPATVHECMDRCTPNAVNLYPVCYESCIRYVEAKKEFDAAEADWTIQKAAVPEE